MQKNRIDTIVGLLAIMLFPLLAVFRWPSHIFENPASLPVLLVGPTATATPHNAVPFMGGIDASIVGALIGASAVIINVIITAWISLRSAHRERQARERESVLKQQQEEERRTQEEESRRKQQEFAKQMREKEEEFAKQTREKEEEYKTREKERELRYTESIMLLQERFEKKHEEVERIRQTKMNEAEMLELVMLRSLTNPERADAYRQALRANPYISQIQIFEMSRPLNVTAVYVRLRLYQETEQDYDLESSLLSADHPNEWQQALFKRLERRALGAVEPDEALRSCIRCILVGDPGAGKTTLLKYLALKSSNKQLRGLPDLPILIGLNAFANSGYNDLLTFAAAQWKKDYFFPETDARLHIEALARAGKILLLLDALDETVIGSSVDEGEASYMHVVNSIKQVARSYPGIYIIVTARKAGYQKRVPLEGFVRLEVLDFRREDIRQFVTNWFRSYDNPRKAAIGIDLNARLEHSTRLQGLVSNPLLLSLTALVYERHRDLPDRRAALYERCVHTLLTEWDATRDLQRHQEFRPEDKLLLLSEIAWHFHMRGQRYFPEDDLLLVIADFLPKIHLLPTQNRQIFLEITSLHGLLKEQAPGLQGFLHLTLQEYFAALYAKDHQQLQALLEHRNDPWWEEVLLLYAGLTHDASALLLKILQNDTNQETFQDDLFMTNLTLAGQCLAARPRINDISLWPRSIDLLFETLTTTPYSFVQERVAGILASIGGSEVNERLRQALSDDAVEESVRRRIADALGHSGDVSVASFLVQLLSQQQMKSVILGRSIALALRNLGDRSAVPRLLQLLAQDHIDRSVRGSIAEALGNLGELSVTPTLLDMLSKKSIDNYIRGSIAETLGMLGDRTIVPHLLQMLLNEKGEEYVRGRVASALGMLGDISVVPVLVQRLAEEDDRFVLQCIALALGKLKEDQVALDLVKLLATSSIDALVRGSIASALGSLNVSSVIPDLIALFALEQDEYVKGCIALALGNLGERPVALDLLQFLLMKQIDAFTRENIAFTLGGLGDQAIVSEMIDKLRDEKLDEYIRGGIVQVLSNMGVRSIVPELIRMLTSGNIQELYLRQSIIEAIGRLGNTEEVIRELISLLQVPTIADSIHRALWSVSRRVGVSILQGADKQKKLEIVKY